MFVKNADQEMQQQLSSDVSDDLVHDGLSADIADNDSVVGVEADAQADDVAYDVDGLLKNQNVDVGSLVPRDAVVHTIFYDGEAAYMPSSSTRESAVETMVIDTMQEQPLSDVDQAPIG